MNIKKIIETYNANYAIAIQTLQAAVRAANQKYIEEMISGEYTAEGLAKRHQARIDKAMAEYEEAAAALNGQAKRTAAEAKAEVMRMIEERAANRPADYTSRAALALQFVAMAGQDITDETAHDLLKDFEYDVPLMRQFRAMIGNQTGKPMADPWGNETFPTTFRPLAMCEKMRGKAEEIEQTAEKIFAAPLGESETFRVRDGAMLSVPAPKYRQSMYELNAVNDAAELDAMAAEFAAFLGE